MQNTRKLDPLSVYRSLNLTTEKNPVRLFLTNHNLSGQTSFDMHFELEIGLLLSGRAKRFYEGYEKEIGPGHLWVCGIWEPHGMQIIEAPCRSPALVLRPDFLSELIHTEFDNADLFGLFRLPPEKRLDFPGLNSRDLEIIDERLPFLLEKAKSEQLIWSKMMLRAALLYIRKYLPYREAAAAAFQESYNKIARGLELVYGSQKFTSTAEAAKASGMSRNGFQELFQKVMGLSFYKFSLRHRLKQAARLIESGELNMDRIAFECGFSDARHLYRAFEKNFGFSVAEYRNSCKKP